MNERVGLAANYGVEQRHPSCSNHLHYKFHKRIFISKLFAFFQGSGRSKIASLMLSNDESGLGTDALKRLVHKAAQDGMVPSLYALLLNESKTDIDEILEHVTEDNGQKTTPLVIAAMLGRLSVVEVLLTKFKVNIEQKSTVKFDGYVIQDATALWCAAGAGHVSVVEALVKNGANVNNATASNSTPLRAACFDGRLDIVKYLLKHGADLAIPNKYDNTCLMISSYKGHSEVVRYLLEKGADPNVKAHCGATSIHFAADCGHLNVVKELVRFNASMVVNGDGMTPLMVAAECGKEDVVAYLLKHANWTISERIQAVELLGAAFANDKELYNIRKTFHHLKRAMLLKMGYYHSPRPDCPPKIPPVEAYGFHKESQNMDELEAIKNDHNALHMEALTIRERILGPQNPEVPHPVIFRGAVFADNGQFDRCISLWMHALVLRQKNSRSIAKDLLRLAQVFSQMVSLNANLSYREVEAVLQHGLQELESYRKSVNCSNDSVGENKMNATELFHNNILSVIYLIAIALRLNATEDELHQLHKLVYAFLKSRPEFKNGYSPLHVVVDSSIVVDDFHVNTIVSFPSPPLVLLFLKCGANIDAVDFSGNSPLHVLAPPQTTDITIQLEAMRIILSSGAHSDMANKQRQTPFTLSCGEILTLLRTHRDLSLRCLAARCIRDNNISYKSRVPECLRNFVDCH